MTATNAAKEPIIRVEGLSFKYATATEKALKEINFTVFPGEYVAILGLSGAGKTTLCLSLNGIIPQMVMGEKEGRCLIKGQDTDEVPVRKWQRPSGWSLTIPNTN